MGADGRNVRNWSFGPFYFHRLTERLFATRGVFLGLKFAYAGRKRPVDIGRTVLLCHGQQLTDGEVEGRNGYQGNAAACTQASGASSAERKLSEAALAGVAGFAQRVSTS
jgi:hypothetical protein